MACLKRPQAPEPFARVRICRESELSEVPHFAARGSSDNPDLPSVELCPRFPLIEAALDCIPHVMAPRRYHRTGPKSGIPMEVVMPTDIRSSEPATISFTATLSTIDDTTLVRLPKDASQRLPSRGQVAVRTWIRGHDFETVVEPDGLRGHWIRVDEALQRVAGVRPGDTAELTLEVSPDWPEPDVPGDLDAALAAASAKIREVWEDITPMARWEWVRWVLATSNPQTRHRRVEVSISKLDSGKRRPCCFDLSSCTDPNLAKSGKLRDFS